MNCTSGVLVKFQLQPSGSIAHSISKVSDNHHSPDAYNADDMTLCDSSRASAAARNGHDEKLLHKQDQSSLARYYIML